MISVPSRTVVGVETVQRGFVRVTRDCRHTLTCPVSGAPSVGATSTCLECWAELQPLELVDYGAGHAWMRPEVYSA